MMMGSWDSVVMGMMERARGIRGSWDSVVDGGIRGSWDSDTCSNHGTVTTIDTLMGHNVDNVSH